MARDAALFWRHVQAITRRSTMSTSTVGAEKRKRKAEEDAAESPTLPVDMPPKSATSTDAHMLSKTPPALPRTMNACGEQRPKQDNSSSPESSESQAFLPSQVGLFSAENSLAPPQSPKTAGPQRPPGQKTVTHTTFDKTQVKQVSTMTVSVSGEGTAAVVVGGVVNGISNSRQSTLGPPQLTPVTSRVVEPLPRHCFPCCRRLSFAVLLDAVEHIAKALDILETSTPLPARAINAAQEQQLAAQDPAAQDGDVSESDSTEDPGLDDFDKEEGDDERGEEARGAAAGQNTDAHVSSTTQHQAPSSMAAKSLMTGSGRWVQEDTDNFEGSLSVLHFRVARERLRSLRDEHAAIGATVDGKDNAKFGDQPEAGSQSSDWIQWLGTPNRLPQTLPELKRVAGVGTAVVEALSAYFRRAGHSQPEPVS